MAHVPFMGETEIHRQGNCRDSHSKPYNTVRVAVKESVTDKQSKQQSAFPCKEECALRCTAFAMRA